MNLTKHSPERRKPQEGFEGSQLHVREVPGTYRRQTQTIRAQPGSFEARYATAPKGSIEYMLYEAGTEFARLCERCGHDAPYTVDWAKVGTPQWRGISDPRLDALEQFKRVSQALGPVTTSRLIDYCVYGRTARQIASRYRNRMKAREMATALGYDLGRAAICFRLIKHA